MTTSRLTGKGQVTVPKQIRERALRIGQRAQLEVDAKGRLIPPPQVHDILSLKGSIRSQRRGAVTVREMNKAIVEGFSKS